MNPLIKQTQSRDTQLHNNRRQRLIDAAIYVIGHYGLPRTTLPRIEKAAEQSADIIDSYFKNKEQLLLAVLDFLASEHSREATEIFSSSAGPTANVVAVIEMNFNEKICTKDKIAAWYAFTGENRMRQDYLRICEEKDTAYNMGLQRQFADLCAQSGKPASWARILAASLEGLIQNYRRDLLLRPKIFNRDDAIAGCRAYMHSLFPEEFSADAPSTDKKRVANGDAEKADLLPVWTYRNQEFFDLEINELFRRNWLLTCHVSNIPQIGDYYTFDCFGERVLIMRDKQKRIHAFHNVCRHRGSRLVREDSGNCPRRITCPFHGWSYGLDGGLELVPWAKTFSNLDKSKIRLKTVECSVWHGFIFIRFTPGGADLDEQMRPLENLVAPYRLEEMRSFDKPSGDDRPYNWKIIHDIDNEGYHVPVGHPGLQSLYGGSYKDEEFGDFSISTGYLRPLGKKDTWSTAQYKKILPDFSHLPEKSRRCWLYVGIFPNLVLAFYPDMMEFYMTLPQTPEQTRLYAGSYALADDRRVVSLTRYLNRRINNKTDDEDKSFVNWMQAGLSSSAFPQFTLSSLEEGVRTFHKKIQSALPVGEMTGEPAFGTVAQVNRTLSGEWNMLKIQSEERS